MNIKKNIDYTAMFSALDGLMTADLPQMELYYEIGRLVSDTQEKGAAVAAAEYLHGAYSNTINEQIHKMAKAALAKRRPV